MKRNIMISVTLLSLLCSCSSNITGISTEESQITNIPSQTDDSSRGSNYRTCPDEKDDFILQIECPTPKSIYDKFQFNLYCAHGWKTDEDDFSHYPDDIESWKFKIILTK